VFLIAFLRALSRVRSWNSQTSAVLRHLISFNRVSYEMRVFVFVRAFVCYVGVLWPNGWMDQDATWYGDRPRPRLHCVRWGPAAPT